METKQIKDLSASLKSYHGAVETKMKWYEAEIKSLKDALAEMQTEKTKAGGSPIGGMKSTEDWAEIKSVAFGEKKAATVSNPPSGGIGAVPTFMSEVIKLIEETNPLFADAHKVSIDGNIAEYVKQTNLPEAEWVGETETRKKSDAKYTSANIPVNKISSCVALSSEMLQDANWFNVQQDILSGVSSQFAVTIGKAILSGDGVKKPLGLTKTKGVTTITGSDVKKVTTAELNDMMSAIPIAADAGCAWYMDKYTLGVIEETYKGDHVVTKSIADGRTSYIFGYPVRLMDFVKHNQAKPLTQSGEVSIIFGNMSEYHMPIKGGLEIQRDDFTSIEQDTVNFWAKQRVGGQLVRPETVAIYKTGA